MSAMHAEGVYQKLPVLLQNVACSVAGWRLERLRYGGKFLEYLRDAEHRITWSAERLQDYRDRRLQEFVTHAATTVPYYRCLFREEGIDPKRIRTLGDLAQLPVLTKDEIQEDPAAFLSEVISNRKKHVSHTSGTTGSGLQFAVTSEAIRQQWAVWWRYRHWHGIQLSQWQAQLGGRGVVSFTQRKPPFWRYNLWGRQVLFSGYHMSPRNLPCYLDKLERSRLIWLHGYPSMLALLATHLIATGDELACPVRWITTGAENLMPQQAEVLERAFGVRPRQHYGMAEAVANFSECEYGRLHVDEDFAAVEFLPSGRENTYKVVGTNFTNLATPLLRYDTQDLVTLTNDKCPCGRPGRIVEAVDGRQEDYVVLSDGARVGRLDHIFKDLVNIREAQVYQREVGEVIIRVVRGTRYTIADERLLLQEANARVGEQTTIHVEYVDELERSSRGKLRLVVSDLEQGKLTRSSPPSSEKQS